jgi:hypothetical protein
MDKIEAGDRVKVALGRREVEGIVFDATGGAKVVVAIVDRERGPVMRTVELSALTARDEDGADDRALRMLIRRTPGGTRGAATSGSGSGQARAGHRRASMHRTTGK